MKIPFAKPYLNSKELISVNKTLKSGILVHGKNIFKFEKSLNNLLKSKFSLSTSSCTSSLFIATTCIGLHEGDDVLVSAQTHVATAHAVEITGAKPIFVDSNLKDGNIKLDDLEKKLTKKTKALIIVHFLGKPQPMKEILKFTKKHKLKLIEDCALALGAKYNGKHVGTFGDYGCFSFHPVKLITTGEGGFLTIKDKKNYIIAKDLRSFGVRKNFYERSIPGFYDVNGLGLNFRLGEINSAIGLEQLKKLPFILKKREKNYLNLKRKIKDNTNFRILNSESTRENLSNYYCMNIILNKELVKKRFKIIKTINNYGIGTSMYYPLPVPHFTYYKRKYNIKIKNYKNSLELSNSTISLPIGPHVSDKEINYIAKIINKVFS